MPRKKLTDRFIASARSTTRETYFDTKITGLALRINGGGTKSWSFVDRTLGKPSQWLALGSYPALSLADARKCALALRKTVDVDGTDPLAERRAERSAPHTLKAGHILESSWGYEQTNRDFYQVVEVKGEKSVVIRKIASKLDHNTCGRNDYVVADPDNFTGEPMLKRANSENRVKVRDWGVWARPWSGQPVYETALGWGH